MTNYAKRKAYANLSRASATKKPPIKGDILKGVVAVVDCRSGAFDCSSGVAWEMEENGARTVRGFIKEVTHVVFKEGLKRTQVTAIRRNLPLVKACWVQSCLANKCLVPVEDFLPQLYLEGARIRMPKIMSPESPVDEDRRWQRAFKTRQTKEKNKEREKMLAKMEAELAEKKAERASRPPEPPSRPTVTDQPKRKVARRKRPPSPAKEDPFQEYKRQAGEPEYCPSLTVRLELLRRNNNPPEPEPELDESEPEWDSSYDLTTDLSAVDFTTDDHSSDEDFKFPADDDTVTDD